MNHSSFILHSSWSSSSFILHHPSSPLFILDHPCSSLFILCPSSSLINHPSASFMTFISIHMHPINQQLCITKTTALVPTPKPTLRSQSELPGGGDRPEVMMVGIPKMFGWAGLLGWLMANTPVQFHHDLYKTHGNIGKNGGHLVRWCTLDTLQHGFV